MREIETMNCDICPSKAKIVRFLPRSRNGAIQKYCAICAQIVNGGDPYEAAVQPKTLFISEFLDIQVRLIELGYAIKAQEAQEAETLKRAEESLKRAESPKRTPTPSEV